jgi:hypothetical protein
VSFVNLFVFLLLKGKIQAVNLNSSGITIQSIAVKCVGISAIGIVKMESIEVRDLIRVRRVV